MADTTGDILRAVAAGRREYAVNAPAAIAAVLETEAAAFEDAAQIADGDIMPLYGLLPSWRWTPEMTESMSNRSKEG